LSTRRKSFASTSYKRYRDITFLVLFSRKPLN
jgi:hypothetical protein